MPEVSSLLEALKGAIHGGVNLKKDEGEAKDELSKICSGSSKSCKINVEEWKETRCGVDGANLWLLYLAIPVVSVPIYFVWKVLVTEDFTHFFHLLILFIVIFIFLIDRVIFGICSLKKIKKQVVNLRLLTEYVEVDCYLNKKSKFRVEEIFTLDKCNYGFWYLRYSYLSDKKDNYCLTTKEGQKFYISGDMPEVDSLIQALQSIIEQNKES